jgi:hypothetical protein
MEPTQLASSSPPFLKQYLVGGQLAERKGSLVMFDDAQSPQAPR